MKLIAVGRIDQFSDRDATLDAPALHQGKAAKHVDVCLLGGSRYQRHHFLSEFDLLGLHDRGGVLQVHQHHIHRKTGEPIESGCDQPAISSKLYCSLRKTALVPTCQITSAGASAMTSGSNRANSSGTSWPPIP